MEDREHTCAPVAIFGFNRPDCLKQVFAQVRKAKPKKLFLILDAPRKNRPDDEASWEACRSIFEKVDWPCDVHRHYAQENMGCRRRMASGISWVFDQVEEAILLEDDCVPSPAFFVFCSELLERYREDMRVGMIAGHVAHLQPIRKQTSYYFDRFPTIWGWATWRRAWAHYDADMREWPRLRDTPLVDNIFRSKSASRRIWTFFEEVSLGKANSWAVIWWYSMVRQNMLCVHPCVNLITNVGICGAHNKGVSEWHDIEASDLQFPLAHPRDVMPDFTEERRMAKLYKEEGTLQRAIWKMRLLCGGWRATRATRQGLRCHS